MFGLALHVLRIVEALPFTEKTSLSFACNRMNMPNMWDVSDWSHQTFGNMRLCLQFTPRRHIVDARPWKIATWTVIA